MSTGPIKFMENALKECVTIPFEDYEEKVSGIMDTFGFVVVTGILSPEECVNAEVLMKTDLVNCIDETVKVDNVLKQAITNVKNSSKHWPRASTPGLPDKGFMSTNGIPQGNFAWEMRTNPKVREIFAHLHTTQEIVVGIDVSFFSADGIDAPTTVMWPHADQDSRLNYGSEHSYQGILYAWDATTSDKSTTVVWPKSHVNEYENLKNAIPISNGKHGLNITNIHVASIQAEFMKRWLNGARRVQVPAGGLIIFNSRTIHQGYASGYRLAQPISWAPKACRSELALKQKLQTLHMGIATTHWAELGIHHVVSFKKNKKPKSDPDHNKCIFSMKRIPSVPVKNLILNLKNASLQDLKNSVKPEYIDFI